MGATIDFLKMFTALFVLLIASFTLNVLIHEMGHYLVASSFDLGPQMHFLNPAQNGITGFAFASEPVAYVEFSYTQDPWMLASVAIAGVLLNCILGLLFTLIYLSMQRSEETKVYYLALVIPCVLSVFLNLNLFSTQTDGHMILEIVRGLIQ